MLRAKLRESGAVLYSVAVLSVLAVVLWLGAGFNTTTANSEMKSNAAPTATFPGSGLGTIPDNSPGTPLNVTFTVSGITGPPSSVAASMAFNPTHTWVGDVDVELIAPNATSFWLFGSTGATTPTAAGDSSDLTGPYNFVDTAAGVNWWNAASIAPATSAVPAGDYRTTQIGPQPVANTSPVTNFTAAFNSVANANGTWTLRFTDNAGGDTGAVSAASLTLESALAPRPKNVDFTGDSKSDFSVVRNTTLPLSGQDDFFRAGSIREKLHIQAENNSKAPEGSGPGTNATWYVNNSSSNGNTVSQFGQPTTDFFVPSDYDGDGKADIAVWRPGAATVAAFYIFQSSNSTLRTELFGQTGDDPAITGDYDGDGKSDVAVYRCPASAGQCTFYYRGSNANPGGNVTFVPWGFGTPFTLFASPGDFDGDGRFDFCVQRTNPSVPGGGQFVLRRSSDGGVEYVNWGLNTDLIVPGDYDGDGKYDFMIGRPVSGQRVFHLLTRTGAINQIQWGLSTDFMTPGDYDGDGKTDIAIWRPNANPDLNFFYVMRSSDSMLQSFEYGQQGDIPVANWAVH